MKKSLLLLVALAFPVVITTGTGRAADTSGPKIVHEPGQKKVKFIDEKGRALKELSLAEEKEKIKIKDDDGERFVSKNDAISVNKKFAAFVKNQATVAITSERLQQRQERGGKPVGPQDFVTEMRGTVALYDAFGNVVFERSVPEGTGISDRLVVSNTGTVALITEGRLNDLDREDRLRVYDQSGMELLVYPRPGESEFVPLDISRLSSNGRYLAARVNFDLRGGVKTVFFDLVKPATWKADQALLVYEITDGGIAKSEYNNEEKKEIVPVQINLKNSLGGE